MELEESKATALARENETQEIKLHKSKERKEEILLIIL